MNDKKPDRNRNFLYGIIGILLIALVITGGISLLTIRRLSSIQSHVQELETAVASVNQSTASLQQQAQQLRMLQTEVSQEESGGISIYGEQFGPEPPPSGETSVDAPVSSSSQEEGTISAPSGSSGEDESMDNLMSQVANLLPTDNGSWSVYVCNLVKGTEGVIDEHPMQAASLIKLYIMGTVYENYEALAQDHGTEQLDQLLLSMITVSDNDAANTLVNWLGRGDNNAGMSAVNGFCRDHGYNSSSMGRMLLASNANGDNYTSVSDCGKFLREVYEINEGLTDSPSLSHADSMYYLLKLQERRNKIPAQMPEGVQVANKTGELDTVENDAGIIYDTAKGIDLVVVFMSENLTSVGSAQTCIAENSRRIYGYFNE